MEIDLIEAVGWTASALTVATYAMNTMMTLRILALLSSVCFLIYGYANGLWPLMAMEATLLPINAYRLWQLLDLRRRITNDSPDAPDDFTIVRRYGKARRVPADTVIFRQGDVADSLYLVAQGQVRIEEYGVPIEAGNIFGEIAFFTRAGTRTATARSVTDTTLYELDRTRFMRLQFEDPSFGLAVMRTVTDRLTANASVQGRP